MDAKQTLGSAVLGSSFKEPGVHALEEHGYGVSVVCNSLTVVTRVVVERCTVFGGRWLFFVVSVEQSRKGWVSVAQLQVGVFL